MKKTFLVCLMRRIWILNIATYGHTSRRILMSLLPALHHLPGLAGQNPEIYLYGPPTVGTLFTQEIGQSSYYQTSSYQRQRGSQVKTLEAQVSKIIELTQCSVKILAGKYLNINKQIYSAPYSLLIFESVTVIHTILRIKSRSLICVYIRLSYQIS